MLSQSAKKLLRDQNGVVLVETLLAVPILTLLTFGILEFGNMMWQRQQLQVGVRDAARYWSRCRPSFHDCTATTARNIAFFGNPAGGVNPRVPGWEDDFQLTITPDSPTTSPSASDIVVVAGTVIYQGSPLFDAILDEPVTIGYWTTMRYMGW